MLAYSGPHPLVPAHCKGEKTNSSQPILQKRLMRCAVLVSLLISLTAPGNKTGTTYNSLPVIRKRVLVSTESGGSAPCLFNLFIFVHATKVKHTIKFHCYPGIQAGLRQGQQLTSQGCVLSSRHNEQPKDREAKGVPLAGRGIVVFSSFLFSLFSLPLTLTPRQQTNALVLVNGINTKPKVVDFCLFPTKSTF